MACKGTEYTPFTDMMFRTARSARDSNVKKREELSSESRLLISNNCTFSDRAFAFVSADKLDRRGEQGSEK